LTAPQSIVIPAQAGSQGIQEAPLSGARHRRLQTDCFEARSLSELLDALGLLNALGPRLRGDDGNQARDQILRMSPYIETLPSSP